MRATIIRFTCSQDLSSERTRRMPSRQGTAFPHAEVGETIPAWERASGASTSHGHQTGLQPFCLDSSPAHRVTRAAITDISVTRSNLGPLAPEYRAKARPTAYRRKAQIPRSSPAITDVNRTACDSACTACSLLVIPSKNKANPIHPKKQIAIATPWPHAGLSSVLRIRHSNYQVFCLSKVITNIGLRWILRNCLVHRRGFSGDRCVGFSNGVSKPTPQDHQQRVEWPHAIGLGVNEVIDQWI